MRADLYSELRDHLASERLVAVATVVAGPGLGRQMLLLPGGTGGGGSGGDLGSPQVETEVRDAVEEAWKTHAARRVTVDTDEGGVDLFIEVHPPPPRLIIVGAVHVAVPLVAFANTMGFRTVVVDPRRTFATRQRFAEADELAVAWPEDVLPEIGLHEGTYVAVLSHDPKIDLPAVELALRAPVRYLGALGSKKTHAKRIRALQGKGFTDQEIARIHAPIGLDLGGRRAEEIALAIMAEIVRARHGKNRS